MTRAIVLQHTPTEGPERVATLLAARGIACETRALHAGAPVPDDVAADREPALAGLPARPPVLHWHGDTFDLPAGAAHLASTAICRNQAYRIGARAFGLQFHCELERETIAVWVREDADYVRGALGPEGGARILADTDRHHADARPIWDRLLGNIISVMQ